MKQLQLTQKRVGDIKDRFERLHSGSTRNGRTWLVPSEWNDLFFIIDEAKRILKENAQVKKRLKQIEEMANALRLGA